MTAPNGPERPWRPYQADYPWLRFTCASCRAVTRQGATDGWAFRWKLGKNGRPSRQTERACPRCQKRLGVHAAPDVMAALVTGFVHGLSRRPEVCPRCGGGPILDEPAYARCLSCGRLWLIQGASLDVQRAFERMSGLVSRDREDGPLYNIARPARGYVGGGQG